MSTFEVISAAVSFTALVGLLASFRFLSRQTRGVALAQVQTSFMAIGHAFLDHPTLRDLFYVRSGEARQLSDDDRERADALAEMLLDTFVLVFELERRMNRNVAVGWDPYIDEMLRTSIYLQDYLRRRRNWYPTLMARLEARDRP